MSMVKVKNPKVGQLVQIPVIEFAPYRKGWNGWIFRVGVIEKLYISKSGNKCATVRYCSKTAGRYKLLPNTETTKNLVLENIFEYNFLGLRSKQYKEFKEAEDEGEQICWDQDTAFLVNHGFIQ